MKFKSTREMEAAQEGLFGGSNKPKAPDITFIQKEMTAALRSAGCDYGILVVETPTAWSFAGGLYGSKPGANELNFIRGPVNKCAAAIWRWTLETRLFIFDAKWNLAFIHFDLAQNRWGVELKYDSEIDGIKGTADTVKHADGSVISTAVIKHGIKTAQRDSADVRWM